MALLACIKFLHSFARHPLAVLASWDSLEAHENIEPQGTRMLVRLFCALALFALPLPLLSQTITTGNAIDIESIGKPPIDLFSVGDGLPDLTAISVSSSPDGHVWVGTMRGLARFNGLKFVVSELPGTSRSKMITAVLAMGENEVWAARANDGVFRWNGQQWQTYEANKSFPGIDVRRFRVFDSPKDRFRRCRGIYR